MKHTNDSTLAERADSFEWEVLADADAEFAEWQLAHRDDDLAALCSPAFESDSLASLTRAA